MKGTANHYVNYSNLLSEFIFRSTYDYAYHSWLKHSQIYLEDLRKNDLIK